MLASSVESVSSESCSSPRAAKGLVTAMAVLDFARLAPLFPFFFLAFFCVLEGSDLESGLFEFGFFKSDFFLLALTFHSFSSSER